MIGVINPNSTFTLESQNDYITPQTIMLKPGEILPAEGGTPSASASASSSTSTHTSSSLSGGAIAGIVIGAVAVIAIIVALFWYRNRRHKRHAPVQPDYHAPSGIVPSAPGGPDDRWSTSYRGSAAAGFPEDKKLLEMQQQQQQHHTGYDRSGQPSPELGGYMIPPMHELVGDDEHR